MFERFRLHAATAIVFGRCLRSENHITVCFCLGFLQKPVVSISVHNKG